MSTSDKAWNIVYLDRAGLPEHIEVPRPTIAHTWKNYASTLPENVIERSRNADILVVNKVAIDESILAACPKLQHIVVSATGYNIVDVAACHAHGVSVSNVPSYAATTVSEHVIGVALTLRREIGRYAQLVEQGTWSNSNVFCLFDKPFKNLRGATMGLIGLGEIGKATAKLANDLGMEVLFSARRPQTHEFAKQVNLTELLEKSDVISVHCSLNDSSLNLIDIRELALMKDSAILINTARGGIIDEQAAVSAIEQNIIAGLAVDVLAQEPPQLGSPLLRICHMPNVIVTPHIAWASDEAMQYLANVVSSNIQAFAKGRPTNIVS